MNYGIRGRVFCSARYRDRGRICRTWTYEVYIGEQVYLTDNTNDHRVILAACLRDVAALRRIYSSGHRLQYTFPELVDMVRPR